jgi:hypothetical protein
VREVLKGEEVFELRCVRRDHAIATSNLESMRAVKVSEE